MSTPNPTPAPTDTHRLLAYMADLELEVDRLRKQGRFVRQEVRDDLRRIERLAAGPAGPAEVSAAVKKLLAVLEDLHDPPGYHPALDQVVAIAVRPLAEQVFRAQRRLTGAAGVALRMDLATEHVEWFPGRLRHILDNLFSNALQYLDPAAGESWVRLEVRAADAAYEIRVSDNGPGLPAGAGLPTAELLSRAATARAAGVGVGLSVVRLLVEQSGGTFAVRSGSGRGSEFSLALPRYDIADYLT